jgi:tripartite-type tricarboxylate transporter receptor subunit TctC
MRRLMAALAILLALDLAVPIAGARAQTFPEPGKLITIIVPYAPGGIVDTTARMMAAALQDELHTSFVIMNRAGAASQVGLTELVRAPPDGYTLAYAVLPTTVTHYLDPTRSAIYTRQSFQPIATHHSAPMVLAVQANSPYRTLRDLVEAARKNPNLIKISDSGLMGTPHLCAAVLGAVSGVQFLSVHFSGGAPSVTALLGGQVDVLAGATGDALPNLQAGNFRVLGVASNEPDPSMPDVPTMKSQGFDVVVESVPGIVAPAGTPPAVVERLTRAIKKVIESPEHQKKLKDLGITPHYLDPEAYTKLWIENETRMKPVLETLANQQTEKPGQKKE